MSAVEVFDGFSLGICRFLQSHPLLCDVTYKPKPGIQNVDVKSWELENAPYVLPMDLVRFLELTDGFHLHWSIHSEDGARTPLGLMSVNGISQLLRISLGRTARFQDPSPGADDSIVSSEDEEAEDDIPDKYKYPLHAADPVGHERHQPSARLFQHKHQLAAFDLDALCGCGRVALVYVDGHSDPEVWFQDLACTWSKIADNFSAYFRVMVLHFGIPNWQYVFTDAGLDPISAQWLWVLSPARYQLDQLRVQHETPSSSAEATKEDSSTNTKRQRSSGSRRMSHTTSFPGFVLDVDAIDTAAKAILKERKAQSVPQSRPSSSVPRGSRLRADSQGRSGSRITSRVASKSGSSVRTSSSSRTRPGSSSYARPQTSSTRARRPTTASQARK